MINYQLPKFELPKLKLPKGKSFKPKKKNFSQVLISAILISSLFGFLAAMIPSIYFYKETIDLLNSLNIINGNNTSFRNNYLSLISREKAVIEAVDKSSKSVVSIIVSKEQPVYETYYQPFYEEFLGEPFFEFMIPEYRQKGVEKRQVGGGTGFIIS
jgi:S1-C subfamily serine protease